MKYTGGPTPGYPVLRIYRVPAANAASYLASASGTNRNPSASGGSAAGKNATLANWSNVDMAAALQHSTTSPAAGDLYVLAIDVSTYPPASGSWSYNWSGEISIDTSRISAGTSAGVSQRFPEAVSPHMSHSQASRSQRVDSRPALPSSNSTVMRVPSLRIDRNERGVARA